MSQLITGDIRMFSNSADSIEVVVAANGRGLSLDPAFAVQLEDLAGSRVRLKAKQDCKTIECTIAIPESKEPIFKAFSSDMPSSYALSSGRIPTTLESYIYGIRVELNGSL